VSARHRETLAEDLLQLIDGEKGLNCANCALMQEQLHSMLLELKSAETIISLLREDVKNNALGSPADRQCIAPSCVTSECVTSESGKTNEKWTSVVCKNNKVKVTCDTNKDKVHHHLVSTNRFAPLATLPENQEEVIEHESSCKRPQSIKPTTVLTSQHNAGWKIPTFVNGRINNNFNDNKKPIRNRNK
jgi:hypothetical protein